MHIGAAAAPAAEHRDDGAGEGQAGGHGGQGEGWPLVTGGRDVGFMRGASDRRVPIEDLFQCDAGSVASVVAGRCGRLAGWTNLPFGIDFGGSGIKGAPVDLEAGDFAADRVRIKTPQPSTPEAVAEVFVELLGRFPDSTGSVGVTVPAVVRHGVVSSAANIDKGWIGTDADALFTKATGRDVHVVNDADAAGLAEVRYGAAKGRRGLVIVTTLGTGHRVGDRLRRRAGARTPSSATSRSTATTPRSRAASSVKENEDLSYPEWAERLTVYYRTLEKLFSPDLIVVGGGVSKDSDEFLHLIDIETEIVPAKLQNRAGIVGAALWAAEAGDDERVGGSRGTSERSVVAPGRASPATEERGRDGRVETR